MVDCPNCGKSNTSFDGYTFCGKCEQKYITFLREELDRENKKKEDLSERAWISETGEQVKMLSDYEKGDNGDKVLVERANGNIEWLKNVSAEPAEIPGGGLIIYLKGNKQ